MPIINVNNGVRMIPAEASQPLRDALNAAGLFLPSVCGGRGLCGRCKCKVLTDAGPLTDAEKKKLTEEDIAAGVRLACQVTLQNDIAIEVPEDLLTIRDYLGVVEVVHKLAPDIFGINIRLIDPPIMKRTAGQYVQLFAPAKEGETPQSRAFSISCPSCESGRVEMIIRRMGGPVTTWIAEKLREGDEVKLAGPFGEFGLSETDRPMIWIAGGTGISAIKALLDECIENGIARPTKFYFGAVYSDELVLYHEMKTLEKDLDWFEYVPALSGNDAPGWNGDRGLITEVVDRHVTQGTNEEAYLCGSPGMIDAAIKILKAKGISDDDIFHDKFA